MTAKSKRAEKVLARGEICEFNQKYDGQKRIQILVGEFPPNKYFGKKVKVVEVEE